jgi:2-dehydropantoate 2-reductase
LGLLLAGRCSLSDVPTSLVTRSAQQSRLLNLQGLKLTEGENELTVSLHCTSFEQESMNLDGIHDDQTGDWILLTVKQQHMDGRLIRLLQAKCNRGARIVCFQNGIGHMEKLTREIPEEYIYTAVTTEAAFKESGSQVIHTGRGETWIGHEDSRHPDFSDSEKKLKNSLQNAGFTTNLSKNINRFVWNKLLINSVINPLTAILRVRNGELITSPDWVNTMKALYDEGCSAANSMGITIGNDLWEQLVDVCRSTSQNQSSMLQDIAAGRKTEVEWINGSIIRIAAQSELKVPTHQAVYNMVKGMEPLI